MQDKAIFMANAMAGGTKAVLGSHNLPMVRHEFKLKNLLHNQVGHWHIRAADEQTFLIMEDLLPCQQRVQLKNMTTKKGTHHNHYYWLTTSFNFANKMHPLKSKSYWTAARRALVIFDWVGHGRN
jgi:hypothetical protein